jgi:hypothetical protein
LKPVPALSWSIIKPAITLVLHRLFLFSASLALAARDLQALFVFCYYAFDSVLLGKFEKIFAFPINVITKTDHV